ncbi:MAG TPA: hypothetical protein VLC98_12055 [Phnomibacter sp.]|nr:hypothetical protein [Phnomibacter sp.]
MLGRLFAAIRSYADGLPDAVGGDAGAGPEQRVGRNPTAAGTGAAISGTAHSP